MKLQLCFLVLTSFVSLIGSAFPAPPRIYIPKCLLQDTEKVAFSQDSTADSEQREIEKVEKVLDWFIVRMNTFFNETSFESRRFKSRIPPLYRELSDLECHISRIPYTPKVKRQLEFSKHMLRVMGNSAHWIETFRSRDPIQEMVRRIAHFNIRILALFTSQGTPDVSIQDYSTILTRFSNRVEYWKRWFGHLEDVPSGLRTVFESQCKKAEKTLKVLAKYK
ncbi:hypothetical protein JCM33374_g3992 [Metschnikowia sp. JCM 33374]|nr:hypothetical protein JCM33374_g3992 [Metschnikowia sp. JCM 33374]